MEMTERERKEKGEGGERKAWKGGGMGEKVEGTILLLCISSNLVFCFQIPRGKVQSPPYYFILARGERFKFRLSTLCIQKFIVLSA